MAQGIHGIPARPHVREVGYIRVAGERGWPAGAHREYHEMVVILEGQYHVRLRDGARTLQAGEIVCYPPGTWHAPDNPPGSAQAICWVQWTEPEGFSAGPYPPTGRDAWQRVTAIATRMRAFWPPASPAEQTLLDSYLYALLFEYRALGREEGGSDIVARAREYILAHMAERITVADLAQFARMGVSQFAHQFAARTGQSPMAYARAMRIAAAKPLLLNTPLPLPVIARRVGFAHPTHFARVFRAVVGVAPRAYRARGSVA
jgi:AraC-like DNA-binding protein